MSQLGESTFVTTEEKPEEEKEVRVKVRYSVFFDGTLNNRSNIAAREQETEAFKKHKKSDSYHNDLSNIAKMEQYVDESGDFDVTLHSYIEGIGTTDEGGDSSIGYALGQGTTGVKAKVSKGVLEAQVGIGDSVKPGAIIEELVFDVFGFSRGAAAARYFVHQLLSEEPLRRGRVTIPARPIYQRLQTAGYEVEPAKIKIRFVGLYDTVASEGMSHSNDTYSLKLDSIGRSEVEKVIHLVSADEHRHNFSLTNIKSAGGRGKEIYLPGAHSDIGGGYTDNTAESLHLNESYSEQYLHEDRKWLIEWGYYREDEIWVTSPPPVVSPHIGAAPTLGYLSVRREGIRHHYDRIPLHIMVEFARKAGMNIISEIEDIEDIPSGIATVFSDLKSYASSGGGISAERWLSSHPYSWLTRLRHDYMHFSAHLTASALVLRPHKPNLVDGKRERTVHNG